MKELSRQAEGARKLLVTQQPENYRIISTFKLQLRDPGSLYGFGSSSGNLRTAYATTAAEWTGIYQAQKKEKGRRCFKNEPRLMSVAFRETFDWNSEERGDLIQLQMLILRDCARGGKIPGVPDPRQPAVLPLATCRERSVVLHSIKYRLLMMHLIFQI